MRESTRFLIGDVSFDGDVGEGDFVISCEGTAVWVVGRMVEIVVEILVGVGDSAWLISNFVFTV